LCLPEHIAIQHDLRELEQREVTLANGHRISVPYCGPIEIRFRACEETSGRSEGVPGRGGQGAGVHKIGESSSAKRLDFGGPRNAAHRVQGRPQ
jgi:hypothetical protein